jgi:iron(III) transport system permease protein
MKLRQYLFFSIILLVFVVFFAWPIFQVVRVGFQGLPIREEINGQTLTRYDPVTLRYLAAVFQDQQYLRGFVNSFTIAISTTLLCMIIAVPLAVLSVKYEFFGKKALSGLLLVPLILPPFVGAIGMRQILGRFGVLTSVVESIGIGTPGAPIDWIGSARMWGVIVIQALSLYPILFLNVSASLANLDPAMEQAAANLGANRWRIFRKITLPLMRPGLFAGGTIVLIWSFTELGTPLMFDLYEVTSVQIFHTINQVSGSPMPYALVIVMLLMSLLLYVVGRLVLGRGQQAALTKASTHGAAIPLRGAKAIGAFAFFAGVSFLALLPHLGVIFTSVSGIGTWYQSALPKVFTLAHYKAALSHELVLPSVQNSVVFASSSVVLDIVIGLIVAWLIVRADLPKFARQTIDTLAMMPLAVPGLVLAFGYLAISLQLQNWVTGWEKSWGSDLSTLKTLVNVQENPTLLLIVAYAMRRLPYVVRSAVAGLEQTPVDLELASRNLGASHFTTLRRITVPLIGANLIAGGLLAFAFAMLEVSDSLVLAQQTKYFPITKAIYDLFGRLRDGPYIASALGVWAMALLTLTILSASSLLGKKMGAIFRV